MKAVLQKIRQEKKKVKVLRDCAFGTKMDKAVEIREEQQRAYDKMNFFINLSDAINKTKKEGKNDEKK